MRQSAYPGTALPEAHAPPLSGSAGNWSIQQLTFLAMVSSAEDERARGESAALCNLANAARPMADNPALMNV